MISPLRSLFQVSLSLFLLQSASTTSAPDDGSRACVTLLQYPHGDCAGDPVSVRNNTVWTTLGMPCSHSDRMGQNSVTDQYCDKLDTTAPEFHQTVFVGDTTCHVQWYQTAYSPQRLTYSARTCTHGYKIATCTLGPCQNPTPSTTLESPGTAV